MAKAALVITGNSFENNLGITKKLTCRNLLYHWLISIVKVNNY
jgi:hypothetical protein